MVFEVLDRVWNSKNQKKSITIGLDRLREAENEVKTGQGRLRKRKMRQREGFESTKIAEPKIFFAFWANTAERARRISEA